MTELQIRQKEVDEIELTEEEIRYAILSAKIKKWNTIRNADYWKEKENEKSEDDGVCKLRKSPNRK